MVHTFLLFFEPHLLRMEKFGMKRLKLLCEYLVFSSIAFIQHSIALNAFPPNVKMASVAGSPEKAKRADDAP